MKANLRGQAIAEMMKPSEIQKHMPIAVHLKASLLLRLYPMVLRSTAAPKVKSKSPANVKHAILPAALNGMEGLLSLTH